jgi:hypothetical protein
MGKEASVPLKEIAGAKARALFSTRYGTTEVVP